MNNDSSPIIYMYIIITEVLLTRYISCIYMSPFNTSDRIPKSEYRNLRRQIPMQFK